MTYIPDWIRRVPHTEFLLEMDLAPEWEIRWSSSEGLISLKVSRESGDEYFLTELSKMSKQEVSAFFSELEAMRACAHIQRAQHKEEK